MIINLPGDVESFIILINKNELTMEMELKNVKVYDALSEGTIAFSGDLYISKTLAAKVSNDGRGGMHRVQVVNSSGAKLIADAEKWCKRLPEETTNIEGKAFTSKVTLNDYIGKLLDPFLFAMDRADYLKFIHKESKTNLLIGIPYDNDCRSINLSFDIGSSNLSGQDLKFLEITMHRATLRFKPGEVFLNSNIPHKLKAQFPDALFFKMDLPNNQKKPRVQLPPAPGKIKKGK